MDDNRKKRRLTFVAAAVICLILGSIAYVLALPDVGDPDRIDPMWAAVSGLFGLGSVIALMQALRTTAETGTESGTES